MTLPVSILTSHQVKKFSRDIQYNGKTCTMDIELRYDDQCKNGHNSFSITGNIFSHDKRLRDSCIAGGCIHEEIIKHFPEYAKYIKWHLFGSNGPMHYCENTLYWAGNMDCSGGYYTARPGFHMNGKAPGEISSFDEARRSAVWPEATDEILSLPREQLKEKLLERLSALVLSFKAAMEEIGFIY